MINKKNEIPNGAVDYYGKEARLRDYVLSKIEKIYIKYGFESLYTPIFENAEVFNGHHGVGEKLLFKLKDKDGEDYVLKYDSTVPLARVVSMYDDIMLPYKRYQLQQSYRDDEIDKGHFREFIQCDGDVVGSESLINDAEFVMISYDGLKELGFEDFTIRLNHRKLIKAIAEKENISGADGLLLIQRAIDMADKINKGGINDVRAELSKTNIPNNVIELIIDLININNNANSINDALDGIENYFDNNTSAKEGISDLREIISILPENVIEKVKIDFTLARGADYYTGFIIEGVINNLCLGAVLGGGRYDDLVGAFGKEGIPAVGLAFGMERLIVALKELGLDKTMPIASDKKILIYANQNYKAQSMIVANTLREKYPTSLVFENELPSEQLQTYCEVSNFTCIAKVNENGTYEIYDKDDFILNNNSVKKLQRKI